MNRLLELERQNLINWYPFKENSTILVLSEDNCIYNYLCEEHFEVDYIECSRTACDFSSFQNKYDYIILDGVLSFAPSYCRSENPFVEMINIVSSRLNETGIMLISIANRIGLKYLCGAPELNTGAIGLGVNGYEFDKSLRTFTKSEINEVLKCSNFKYTKFYYPYPDHVYPKEIYTDETINSMSYGKDYYELLKERLLLYNESLIAEQLVREKVADVFANSFLIEVCKDEMDDIIRPIYVKINSDRNECFRIRTSFVKEKGSKYVIKESISNNAVNHIKHLHESEQNVCSQMYYNLCGEFDNNSLKYEFLNEKTLDDIIAEYIPRNSKKEIIECLDGIYNSLLYDCSTSAEYFSKQFIEVFGSEQLEENCVKCVNPANIDLICDNIFVNDFEYKIIDCEWTFNFNIPISFIMWRNLNELYGKHNQLNNIVPRNSLFDRYSINIEDETIFQSWNKHFTEVYVGANKLESLSRDKYQLSLDEVLNKKIRRNMLCSSLYIDYGEGYSEENKLYKEVKLSQNEFLVEFKIDDYKNIKQLRWDPVEEILCLCFAEVNVDGNWIRIKPDNAQEITEEWDCFNTMDPRYFLNIELINQDVVSIHGRIQYFDDDKTVSMYSGIEDELKMSQGMYASLENELNNSKDMCINLENELNKSKDICLNLQNENNQKNIRINEEIESKNLVRKYASIIESEYEELIEENDKKINTIFLLEKQLETAQKHINEMEIVLENKAVYEELYHKVITTKGWRVLDKLRNLKNRIKG